MNLKSRKIISMALVFFMMVTILPMAPVTAHAASYADAIKSITIMGQNPATMITDVNVAQNGTGSSGGTWTYNPSGVGGVYPTITLNDYNGGAILIECNDTAEPVIVYINVIGECKIESLGTVVQLNAPNSATSQINFYLHEGSSLYLNGSIGVWNNSKAPEVNFNGAGNVTIGTNQCAIWAQYLISATTAKGSITVENGTVLKARAQGTVVSTGYTKNDGNYTNVALNVRNGASVEFTKNGAGTEPVVEGYDAITVPEGYKKNLSADGSVFTLAKPNTLITSATATVDAPIVGNTPDMTAESGNSEQYTVTVKRWNEGFGWHYEISSTTPFEAEKYIVVVTFAPKAGYEFASDAKYYINGVEAEYYEDEGGIWQATFDATQINYIDKVEATVDAPIGGKTPDMIAESGDSSKYSVTVVTWYEDEYPFDTLAETDTFESGKDYGVLLKFTPVAGYEFASNAEYKVNGKNADFLSVEEGCQAYFTAEVAKYNITVTGGTASANKATVGTEITLTVDESAIPAGKVFDKWEVVSGGVTIEDNKFKMPNADVEINAVYKEKSVTITGTAYPAEGGTVTGSGKYTISQQVFLTAIPNTGYKFVRWEENGIEVHDLLTYSFDVTSSTTDRNLVAVFEVDPTAPQPTKIDLVNVTVTEPEAGKTPAVPVVETENVMLVTSTWKEEGKTEKATTFEAGKTYVLEVLVNPEIDYDFATNPAVKINGKDATVTHSSPTAIMCSYKFAVPEEGGETPPTEYDITVTGGTASASKATAGTEITLTVDESAIPAGKVFDNWKVVSGGVTVTDGKFTMPANAVKVEATYKDQSYTVNYLVTLEYNNGSEPAKFLVESGATVTKPADPTREGYIFKGWFLGETEYDFATKVTGPITLIAKWEAKEVVPPCEHEYDNACDATCNKCDDVREVAGHTGGTATCQAPAKCTVCGQPYGEKDENNHIYATEWTTDRSNHWHKATCGHDVIADKAAHSYGNDRVCDICNYKKPSSGGSYGGGSYVAPDKDADNKLRIVMQINNKNILVNGKTMVNDVAPVIVGDRTLVPIRVVTELLGGSADWDNDTRTVTLNIDGKTMNMTIGKPIPGFGTSAVIMNDRTYVPVRYVMEKLGAEVEWINATRQIIIEK